jgi:hypothetical protein
LKALREPAAAVTSLQFFSKLRWLDGRPLLDTIEGYRRELFTAALDTFEDGRANVDELVRYALLPPHGATSSSSSSVICSTS